MSENLTEKKKLTTNQIIIIAGFSVIVVMLIVIGVVLYIRFTEKPQAAVPDSEVGNLVVDESNLSDIKDILSKKVEDGMFEVNMNTSWTFPDGKSASTDAYVGNGLANNYPITFEIIIEEEVIYSSSLIPVGKQIKDIILDKDLPEGIYDATCMYRMWDEEGKENSSFGVSVKLTVLK